MTASGYWPSDWPVECGGNHRPKAAPGAGLAIMEGERLVATTRQTGRWPVMFVQRNAGELYLQGTTTSADPEVAGWVERVDPATLEPRAGSGDLPAGGHEWCGSIAVHANGDLYTVNGSFVHRLSPDCEVLRERPLPVDHAHNGLLVLTDGNICTKDIRVHDEPSTMTICDDDLNVLATVSVPEPSMGRIASVTSAAGNDEIYVPGTTRVFRYAWDGERLELDREWQPPYRHSGEGGLAWDSTIVNGRVWLMDNGSISWVQHRFSEVPTRREPPSDPGPMAPWTEPLRVVSISVDDADDVTELVPFEDASGWIVAPPLVHGDTLVCWDSGNGRLAAFDVTDPASPTRRWERPLLTTMQPILFPDTGELVVNDWHDFSHETPGDDIVAIDIESGDERARSATGALLFNGMFLCPGWDRDLYYCSFDAVARVRVT